MTKMMPYSKAAMVLMLLMLVYHIDAYALALSEIKLNSSLNQPVNATIELLSATPAELDSLNAIVTGTKRESTGRGAWSQLKVELVRMQQGNSYLMITSKDNMREPVLNFLLELSWSSGHIQREYSILLNLPH